VKSSPRPSIDAEIATGRGVGERGSLPNLARLSGFSRPDCQCV
jgi:hypothetical protein